MKYSSPGVINAVERDEGKGEARTPSKGASKVDKMSRLMSIVAMSDTGQSSVSYECD